MVFRSDHLDRPVVPWWPEDFAEPRGVRFFVVLHSAAPEGAFENRDEAARIHRETELELADATGADRVYVGWANTYMGADGTGLGVVFESLAAWADVITVAGALALWKDKILTVIRRLRARFGEQQVYLSPDALAVLVLADIVQKSGLDPLTVRSVQHVVETAVPMEPREELQHMYSCYAVTVSAPDSSIPGGLSVWCYFVTSLGHIISRARQSVPYQQDPAWETVATPGKKLNGL